MITARRPLDVGSTRARRGLDVTSTSARRGSTPRRPGLNPRLPRAVPPAEALLLPLLEDVARHADAREAREAVTPRRHDADVAPQPLAA